MYAHITMPDWLTTAKTVAGILPRWIFRGQTAARWGLETTLERAAVQRKIAFASDQSDVARLTKQAFVDLTEREDWILKQFQRRAHLVMNTPPPQQARLDWLAAIQHYGGPTRLLDFTHSFYVATFFAVEQATEDAAVWALWAPKIETNNAIAPTRLIEMNQQAIELAESVLSGSARRSGILNVEPFTLNERMAAQKGVFVLPLDITIPFMENLGQAFGFEVTQHQHSETRMDISQFLHTKSADKPDVVKFVFPRKEHDVILQDLAAMNIDSSTLFPGLQGYARSMYRHV